jgi:hypothetical protein
MEPSCGYSLTQVSAGVKQSRCVENIDTIRRRLQVDENAVMVGGDLIVGTPKTHKRRSVPFFLSS